MRISPMGYYDKSESGGFKKFLTVFFSIMVAVLVIGGIAYFVLNGFKNEEAGIKLEKAETLISLNGQAYTEPNYACRASIPLSGFVTGQKMVDANGIKIKVMQKTDSTYVRVRVFYESKSQEFDSSSATAVALNSGFVFSVNEGWVFDTYTSALDKYFYLGDDDKVVATTDGSEYVLNLEDILFPNLTAYNLDASLLATENLFLTVEAQAVQSESVQINSLNSLITVIDNNKLYPKPVANGYFLQFNTMGGKETSNYVIKAGDPFTMPSVPNVKRWYQDEKYSTAYFVAGEVNTRINANTTFYARYSITNSIFVIFEKDVASFGTLPQNGEASISGENYLINCNLKLVKRGFKHIGWKIKGTYNALEMEQGKLKIPTTIKRNSAVTLVPVWEEEVYAVIFTTDDLTLTYGDNNNTHIGANKTDTTTAIDTVVYEI